MLKADGSVAGDFRWPDPQRTDSPRDVRTAEGISFDDKGRADAAQRLRPRELAALLGLDVTEDIVDSASGDLGHEQRFWIQLRASRPAEVVASVEKLIADWRDRGGYLEWGYGAQAVAFPSQRAGGEQYWPWTVRPTAGTVEVDSQYLTTRPPFDDTAMRDELRRRINRIPGVDLPLSRLELRPSFPLQRLADPAGLDAAIEAQAWFLGQLPAALDAVGPTG